MIIDLDKEDTHKYLGRTGNWTKILYGSKKVYVSSTYVKKYTVTSLTKSSGGATKASNDFITPTSGPITQGYGKASGVYGYTFHNGIDYGAPKGTPVYATAAGKVITSQYKGAYGNYIMVKHTIDGASFTSLYAHLNSRSVSVGQSVSKGQVLGTVGATGNAFGTHLHFELHRGTYVYSATSAASSVNPLNYL